MVYFSFVKDFIDEMACVWVLKYLLLMLINLHFLVAGARKISIDIMDVSNSSSILAEGDQEPVGLSFKQQKIEKEMDSSLCSLGAEFLSEVHLLNCAAQIGRQHAQNRQEVR